jgi:hypothetical protein
MVIEVVPREWDPKKHAIKNEAERTASWAQTS